MRFPVYFRIKSFVKLLPVVALLYSFCYVWQQLQSKQLSDQDSEPENEDFRAEVTSISPYSLSTLSDIIEKKNREQLILNADKFGSLQPNDTIIVIQVHNRIRYLSSLIESLKQMVGVEKSLLIFSHDVFDVHLNNLIENIHFCKVLQIFYPFSLQLHPNTFPGPEANDCPRNINKQEALLKQCNNAEDPDTYGHYREAQYTQTKHHWFWKINHIFDKLNVTRNHKGFVVFLEEDHYASPDMLHVLHLMIINKSILCDRCDVLTVGSYSKTVNYAVQGNKFEVQKWSSSKHNMGFAFDRETWFKIKSCAKSFCKYDDYNWDWSLQHISLKCLNNPLITMAVAAPRVFHIGECGVHHKSKNCSVNKLLQKVKKLIDSSHKQLFPSFLSVQKASKRQYKMSKANGGWSDRRDHHLCLKQLKSWP